jgi:hypothetical protein
MSLPQEKLAMRLSEITTNAAEAAKYMQLGPAFDSIEACLDRIEQDVELARTNFVDWREDERNAKPDLSTGQAVIYTDDIGNKHPAYTRSKPWMLGDGTWVIKITGRPGGVCAKRIERAKHHKSCGCAECSRGDYIIDWLCRMQFERSK